MPITPVVLTLVRDGAPVRVRFRVGDGAIASWTVALKSPTGIQRWDGRTDDDQDDQVELSVADLLAPGALVGWWVTVFAAPHGETAWSLRLRVEQGEQSVLEEPIRHHGRIEPGKTHGLKGRFSAREAP